MAAQQFMVADFLNRSCAFDARFGSILLAASTQNPFSTASAYCSPRRSKLFALRNSLFDHLVGAAKERERAPLRPNTVCHEGNPAVLTAIPADGDDFGLGDGGPDYIAIVFAGL